MTHKNFTLLLVWTGILIALTGSVFSALNICTGSSCDAAHSYRLFGIQFAAVGIPIFLLLAGAQAFREKVVGAADLFDAILFGCSGAEIWFLYIQKYQIGHWCPVCVVIAVAVFFLSSIRIGERMFIRKEASMGKTLRVFRKILPVAVFFAGLSVAMIGVRSAEANSGLAGLWLGNAKSAIEIYFVGDWYCPFCKKAEATIEPSLQDIGKIARYTFLDYPVHQESFVFIPYNISLLLKEKSRYMVGRKALMEVADKTRTPDDDTIREALSRAGIKFKMADVSTVLKTSNDISKFLLGVGIKSTPVVVIRNTKSGEQRFLTGTKQISANMIISTAKGLLGS